LDPPREDRGPEKLNLNRSKFCFGKLWILDRYADNKPASKTSREEGRRGRPASCESGIFPVFSAC
jgi:hypothetical protein